MQMREKVGKSRNIVFFQWFVASEGRKVGSLKRRVRNHLARREIQKKIACRCGAKHMSKSKCTKPTTPFPDHFWKLRCRKSARRCGAKHISKSKCNKAHHCRTTFGSCDVEEVHAVVARSTFRSQNVQNTPCSDHFWKLRCRKSARRCGAKHISKSKCTKHKGFGPLLEVQMSLRFASLHYATLHYTTLHYTSIHYTTLHSTTLLTTTTTTTTLHYTRLHSTTLNYTTLHYTTLHYTTLHDTTLHYITLHFATFHYTSLLYTTLHSTPLHCTTTTTTTTQLHSATLHYTKLHYATLHYLNKVWFLIW